MNKSAFFQSTTLTPNDTAVYRIPADTGILVPKTILFDNGGGVTMFWDKGWNIKQCIPSKTTREVVYEAKDLGYDPQTKESFGKFPKDVMGPREIDYYVFKLPENSRLIPYIFVPFDDVKVERWSAIRMAKNGFVGP